MRKEQAALIRRRNRTFSPADYDKRTEEIARQSAERFARGSVNTNLLTEDGLAAEKAERRKLLDRKSA